jgi:diguanylate cyclase (GGDEF)-like protein
MAIRRWRGRRADQAMARDTGQKGLWGGLLSPSRTGARRGDEQQLALQLLREYEQSGRGWFWATDADGRISYISQPIADQLKASVDALVGHSFQSLFVVDDDDQGSAERTLTLLMTGRKTFSELIVRTDAEVDTWLALTGRPKFSDSGHFEGFRGSGVDVTAARLKLRDSAKLANSDALTGLANRALMARRLDSALLALQGSRRSFALLMIDLDRFKAVNDTLGHQSGDDLLKQAAQRLRSVTTSDCEIGRLGGDEFQIIIPNIEDRGRLGEIARAVIEQVSEPYQVVGGRCTIGASVGIAVAPYDGDDAESIVRSADLALYAAKGGGRGQFRFYSADLHADAERRRRLEDDLRHALSRGEISLLYQPQVEAKSSKVTTLAARLHWDHPDIGEVPPDIFLPIAEKCELAGPLYDWAIQRACEDAVQWPGNVRVAVDVIPQQLRGSGFAQLVTQALARSELAPERLELELSESVFDVLERSIDDIFSGLKMLGVRLVVDEFGTGQSSLAHLRSAPVDKIKIGRVFTRDVATKASRDGPIVKGLVALAKAFRIETAADGIEAQDQLKVLTKLGVDHFQGDMFADALPFAEVLDAMASGGWVLEPGGPSRYRAERRTVLRKVGLVHDDFRYEATMRNLSRTGCMVEGLMEVPLGTHFAVDFGDGQLAVGVVRRAVGSMLGLEFEVPLVDDGAGGLVTRTRVSREALASIGLTSSGAFSINGATRAKFVQARESRRSAYGEG